MLFSNGIVELFFAFGHCYTD